MLRSVWAVRDPLSQQQKNAGTTGEAVRKIQLCDVVTQNGWLNQMKVPWPLQLSPILGPLRM